MTSSEQEPRAERIAPTHFGAPQETPIPQPAAQPTVHQPLFWAAVLAIALLLILVVLWLPSQINTRSPVSSATQAEPVLSVEAESEGDGITQQAPDTEEVLANRQQAQRIADALQLRRAELERLAVERWAAADYQQIQVNDERARNYFDERDFKAAATYWQKAIADANTLLAQVEPLLKATIVEGHQEIAAGDIEAAIKAFDLALAIHPDNVPAAAGMRRAQNLEQVLRLLAAAENHEMDDQLDQALMLYRQALSLDPQAPGAKEGVLRVAKGMQDWEFRIALSTAQQALEAQDFSTAKREFLKADNIKARQRVVEEGLAQAELGLQAQEVAALRRRAEAAAEQENWQRASEQFQKVLKLDPTLDFAQRGLAQSSERLNIDRAVQGLLDEPERLYSEQVLNEARDWLQRAQNIEQEGPRLQQQRAALAQAIAKASETFTVTLISDNKTNVMIYRVGRFGQFEQQRVDLSPGDYVVVGRCEGYRDVRKTLSVRPGMNTVAPFEIRCTDKI